ncbi:hypothetical protein HY407_00330 [Candidatus Gottesmanbacteria bacterium]|nr:hypothetical protein [Candidatus Roizmanbacteria bacterium]MBI4066806.1 hypothetical protein [Candidatus Gottesmanbacteria bacterium]
MARVFLDTNYFIDSIHRKPERRIVTSLENHIVYISPLSLHIYCYIYKLKIPDRRVSAQRDTFQIVELSEDIVDKSLIGPTPDFEDNVQLHSAASAECDFFLTEDKQLLKLTFFGKVQLVNNLIRD